MLSPENPNCSPEVLGTTHPLLLLTLSAVSVSASVTVTISSSFFFGLLPVSQRSVYL